MRHAHHKSVFIFPIIVISSSICVVSWFIAASIVVVGFIAVSLFVVGWVVIVVRVVFSDGAVVVLQTLLIV